MGKGWRWLFTLLVCGESVDSQTIYVGGTERIRKPRQAWPTSAWPKARVYECILYKRLGPVAIISWTACININLCGTTALCLSGFVCVLQYTSEAERRVSHSQDKCFSVFFSSLFFSFLLPPSPLPPFHRDAAPLRWKYQTRENGSLSLCQKFPCPVTSAAFKTSTFTFVRSWSKHVHPYRFDLITTNFVTEHRFVWMNHCILWGVRNETTWFMLSFTYTLRKLKVYYYSEYNCNSLWKIRTNKTDSR